MVRFDIALLLGRLLPTWSRDRVFESAYHELLAEYLAEGDVAARPARLWRRGRFELRAVGMALECWRLLLIGRFGRDEMPAGNARLPAGNAAPPNRPHRRGALMESFARDLKYASRQLFKAPIFTATAVLIVAIGIGANTAAFSVVNAMLFRPLPFADPGQLVDIYQDSDDGEPNSSSYPAYRDIAGYGDLFTGVTATFVSSTSLQREDGLVPMSVEFSPSNYYEVLGLRVTIGRWFEPVQDVSGGAPETVLTHRAWQEKYGGDAAILGTVLRMNGSPVTVVGVGPEGYNGFLPLNAIDGWLSLSSLGPVNSEYAMATLEQRGDHWFFIKGRLRDGVTATQVQEAMNALAAQLAREFPEHNSGRDITVFGAGAVRMHPSIDAMLTPSAGLLMAVVGLVLLVACSNLANLLLARASTRGREMSTRVAVGANRGQVARQLLTESVLLSVVGGLLGVLVANWAVGALMSIQLPLPIPVATDLSLDARVLAFALVLSVVTGIAFGLAPAVRASRPDLAVSMRDDAPAAAWRRRRLSLKNGLVVAQVAMSFVLLVATGLFIRSLDNAENIETGFSVDQVAYLRTNPGFTGYGPEDSRNIMQDLVERARGLPGVESASLATVLPLTPRGTTSTVIEGYEPPSGLGSVEVPFSIVDEDYFETMGIPVLLGRPFSNADNAGGERVVVISEAMANRYWSDGLPIGRRLRSEGSPDNWVRVIGVVGDSTVRDLTEDPTPLMYRPWAQSGPSSGVVFVRTAADPASTIGMLRAELRSIDAEIPVLRASTMGSHLSDSLSLPRLAVRFIGGFGFVALVLASLGLYGIVSFAVGRRRVEVGVRMALGAQSGQVIWLVLREVAGLVVVGVVLGAVLSAAATAGLGGILFDVSPTDPLTFLLVSAVMLAVALGAAMIPALRAAKADPVLALRQ